MSERIISIHRNTDGTVDMTTEKKGGSVWILRGLLMGVSYEQSASNTKEETVVIQGEHRVDKMGDQSVADGGDSHIRKDR